MVPTPGRQRLLAIEQGAAKKTGCRLRMIRRGRTLQRGQFVYVTVWRLVPTDHLQLQRFNSSRTGWQLDGEFF
jgi:hypothetical protein